MLTLFEELFLLGLNEEKGTIVSSMTGRLAYGLSGALIAELALLGKVKVGEKRRLELVDPAPTGDEFLDEALEQIQASDQVRKVNFWIRFLSDRPKRFRQRLGERLVDKGILVEEENHWASVVPFVGCPEQNASAKYWVKGCLREAALTFGNLDLRDLALLSLVQSCGLLVLVFTRDERKAVRRRIYELMIGKALNSPVAQAVEEISAGVESLVGTD